MMKIRFAIRCLILAFMGLWAALPLAAQAQTFTLATNNVAFNFTTLGLNPALINSVTVKSIGAVSTPAGFFTPYYTNFSVANYPQMSNGTVICSQIVYGQGVTYQIQLSDGYALTTTNFCIPSSAALDANGNAPANQWLGNGLSPNFTWSSPFTTNYSTIVTNVGALYSAGTGLVLVSNVFSLYSAPTIASFVNNQNSLEIGQTVTSTLLTWTLAGGAITNQSLNESIGSVPIALRSYTNVATYTTARTYQLTVTDGVTTNTASTSVNFYSQEYWGASSQVAASITDAQIIALGNSQFATSRQMTQTIPTSNNYLYICYPASFGAATFIVNGFPDAGWTVVTRSFVNASGAPVSYNIYQHNFATIGSFTVQVQ